MKRTGSVTANLNEVADPKVRLISDIDYIFEVTKNEYDENMRCPDFPDKVVVHSEGEEWINAPTALSWIIHKLDVPMTDAEAMVLNDHLVKLVDTKKHTFDVFGLRVQRGAHGDRNGIFMKFHVRDAPRSPRPKVQPANIRFQHFKDSLAQKRTDTVVQTPAITTTSRPAILQADGRHGHQNPAVNDVSLIFSIP